MQSIMLHENWSSRWSELEVNNNQGGHEEGPLKREWEEAGAGGGGPRYQELRPYMKHEYSPPRAHDYRRDLGYDTYLEPYGELDQ